MNNKKTWFFSFLIMLLLSAWLVVLYGIFYFFPEIHEGAVRVFGGSGVLAPFEVVMWKLPQILIFGTPLARLFLYLVGDDEEGGDGDE